MTLVVTAGSSGRNNKYKKQHNVDQYASSHETNVGSGESGKRPHIVLEEEEGASKVSGKEKPRSMRNGRCNEKRQDTQPSLSKGYIGPRNDKNIERQRERYMCR